MPERQYVAAQFNPWDRRAYTYHNDGEPLAEGDKAVVESARGGEVFVTVISVSNEAPKFPTKPILRKAPPKDEPDLLGAGDDADLEASRESRA